MLKLISVTFAKNEESDLQLPSEFIQEGGGSAYLVTDGKFGE